MNLPIYYPFANRTTQWKPNLAGGATFDHVEKLCLHTTETRGWPGYPTFCPHLTYDPWKHEWRQHIPLTKSATTLADPSSTSIRENRDYVIQVEIVAYCDPELAEKYGYFINDVDDVAVHDLAELIAWLEPHGLQMKIVSGWLPYPDSYGRTSVRMSSSEFDSYRGILGHEHVSGNDHGDPGNPPWLSKMLQYAKEIVKLKEGYDMVAAEGVYERTYKDQAIVANKDTTLKINDDEGVSAVIGKNAGIDLRAAVSIKNASGVTANVRLWFIQTDIPRNASLPSRTHWQSIGDSDEIPVTSLDFSLSTEFKQAMGAAPAGYSRRLRVRIRSDQPITVTGIQVTGWKMPS